MMSPKTKNRVGGRSHGANTGWPDRIGMSGLEDAFVRGLHWIQGHSPDGRFDPAAAVKDVKQ
jgi:hypothetical protein